MLPEFIVTVCQYVYTLLVNSRDTRVMEEGCGTQKIGDINQ